MDQPVLLTGASGRVGQAILEGIGDRYRWRLLDREPPTGEPGHEFVVADVTDEDARREGFPDRETYLEFVDEMHPGMELDEDDGTVRHASEQFDVADHVNALAARLGDDRNIGRQSR